MNTKQFGQIIESKFLFECAKIGLTISQPIGDNAPYDFILDKDGELLKIQCKSMRHEGNGKYTSETHKKIGHRRKIKEHYGDSCDFFFLYNVDSELQAFIKVSECATATTLWDKSVKKSSDKRIRYIQDYQDF